MRCNGQGHMWSGFGPEAVPVFLFRGEEGGCRHLLSPQVDRFIEAFLAGAVHGDFPLFVIAFVVVPEYIEGCVEGVVRWVEVPLLLDPGGPLLIRFFEGLKSVRGGHVPDPVYVYRWASGRRIMHYHHLKGSVDLSCYRSAVGGATDVAADFAQDVSS